MKIYLKEDSLEFLNHKKISKLIKKYSEFIDFPIYLNNKKEVEEEVTVPQEQSEEDDDVEIKDKEEEKPKTEKVKRTVYEWELINNQKVLWLREKDDIYEEDYIEFYKSISKQSNPPMNWIHFNTEGQVIFTSILYIPNRAPHDFYANYNSRKNELKLYVRRVLIAQEHTDLIPKYLSFVMGVIDSDDFPINVARETLQNSKTFKIINQRITKKILDMITEIAKWEFVEEDEFEEDFEMDSEEIALLSEEEYDKKKEEVKNKLVKQNKERYEKFYDEFGKAIKLGILEDKTNRNKLASLSRWYSTRSTTDRISFDDYIKKMKPIQDQIYFFSGEDRKVLQKSPLVVGLVRKGYEVILCDDPIDEYVFNVLREYQKKNIVNVGKGDFKMPDDDELERKKQKFLAKKYEPYVEYAKKLLFEKVANVIISNRLTKEPCVVVADTYGHSSFMDKIQKAQMFAGVSDNPVSDFKKIMEINPHHRVNQIILEKINANETDTELEELVELLYETAAFHSGFNAKDSNDFVKRFYKIYSKAMGVVNL